MDEDDVRLNVNTYFYEPTANPERAPPHLDHLSGRIQANCFGLWFGIEPVIVVFGACFNIYCDGHLS